MIVPSDLSRAPQIGQPGPGHCLIVVEKPRSNKNVLLTSLQLKGGERATRFLGAF